VACYHDRGLGVTSNDFGQQEPGSAVRRDRRSDKQFYRAHYSIDFPLAEKGRAVGADAHPFYRWIAAKLGQARTPQ
jgi:glutathione peroxidase